MPGGDHEFEVGDEFETLETHRWRVTNRMVDVDTEERLYCLQGLPGYDTNGQQKVIAESKLVREHSGWCRVHAESEL